MRRRLSRGVAVVLALASTSVPASADERRSRIAHCRAIAAKEPSSAGGIYEQAFCLTRLGNWVGAVNAATRWLEHPEAKAERKKIVRERILPFASKTARIVFDPENADIVLDGNPAKTASGVIYISPGTHRIVARTADGELDREIEAFAGETRVLEISRPSPAAPPAPPPEAAPIVTSAPVEAPPVVARAESDRAKETSRLPIVLALGGAAVAAAGAGTWLMFSGAGDHDDAAGLRRRANHDGYSCYGRNNPTCVDADDLATNGDRKRTAAVGCFAGAGAILATTLLVHVLSPRAELAPRIAAAPTRGGAVVSGSVRF